MKFETHLHTLESSPCGKVDAKTAVREYHRAGYDGLVVTDHFGTYPLDWFSGSLKDRLNQSLKGYRIAKETGDKLGMTVLFGSELRLEEGPEDLLIYGITPEFLLNNPDIYKVSLPELSKEVHRIGGIIVQAHPFRDGCQPREPEFLDGAEVYNGNPRHNNRNHLALAFAEVNHLIVRTSGSDYHQLEDLAKGGVIFSHPIDTEQDFVRALLQRENTLIQAD